MAAPPPREKETYEGMTLACVICRHIFTRGTPYKSVSRKAADGSLVSDAYHPSCFAAEEESMQKRAADELARSNEPTGAGPRFSSSAEARDDLRSKGIEVPLTSADIGKLVRVGDCPEGSVLRDEFGNFYAPPGVAAWVREASMTLVSIPTEADRAQHHAEQPACPACEANRESVANPINGTSKITAHFCHAPPVPSQLRLTRRFNVQTTFVIEDTEASGNYDGDVEEILRWNLVAMMNSLSGHFAAKKDANAKVSFENADVRLSTFPSRRATEPEPVRTSTETAYDEAGEWAGEVPPPLGERPAILNTPEAVRVLEERVTAVELSVSGLLSLSRRQNPQRY